jgi:hypothetical protein
MASRGEDLKGSAREMIRSRSNQRVVDPGGFAGPGRVRSTAESHEMGARSRRWRAPIAFSWASVACARPCGKWVPRAALISVGPSPTGPSATVGGIVLGPLAARSAIMSPTFERLSAVPRPKTGLCSRRK